MDLTLSRRRLLGLGAALPLLALPGCASLGGFGLEDAIRRLLTLSSQRAFARLLQEDGFLGDELARVPLPPQVAAAGSVLLRTPLVRDQLLRVMNRAAANAAEAAAPVVYEAVRTMSIADAVGLVRGGPTAATGYLQRVMGPAIVDAMFPGVGRALQLFDDGVGTAPRELFQRACGEQQEHEHHRGIEPDVCTAADRLDDAGAIGEQHRTGDRRVHAELGAQLVVQLFHLLKIR